MAASAAAPPLRGFGRAAGGAAAAAQIQPSPAEAETEEGPGAEAHEQASTDRLQFHPQHAE